MNKIEIISVSGGKDSAALVIYLLQKYPNKDFTYLFFDTGEELDETYKYLNKLESLTGIKIEYIKPKKTFEELLLEHNNYLPSPMQRWCTKKLKIETFLETIKRYENYEIYNYVGIRADEDRSGLVVNDNNIKTIMPFKEDGLTLNDIKRILEESGLGLPEYYKPIYDKKYDISYFRSRSGCYFCFFMRQIEWVWLYETHKDEFFKAMKLEKEGFSWIKDMPLKELIKSENIDKIKKSYKKQQKNQKLKNATLLEIIESNTIAKDLCSMCL